MKEYEIKVIISAENEVDLIDKIDSPTNYVERFIRKSIKITKDNEKGFKKSLGVAEFKISCNVDVIEMSIHDKYIVAETDKDIYLNLFDMCKEEIEKKGDELK